MGSGDPRLAAISLVELLRRGPRNGRGGRLGLLGGRGGPNGRMGDAPHHWFADRRVHRRPYWDREWPAGGLATPPTPNVTSFCYSPGCGFVGRCCIRLTEPTR